MFDTPYVFVYGTLKRGFGNNALLQRGDSAKFISPAYTSEKLLMVSPRGFPYVIDPNRHDLLKYELNPVIGELFRIEKSKIGDLVKSSLDGLEGYPRFYDRKELEVVTKEGEKVSAMMYFKAGGNFPDELCPTENVNGVEMFYWQNNPLEG